MAEKARKREDKRQDRIDRGEREIGRTFRGFDNGFFNNYRRDFLDANQPQIDDKFGDAKEDLTYALARAGTSRSSIAGDKRGDLNKAYTGAMSDMVSQANQATDQFRGQVAEQKSGLIGMLQATGDATRMANEATARASNLRQKVPTYNPIGDVFGGMATGIGTAVNAKREADMWDYYRNGSGAGASGSARIVR